MKLKKKIILGFLSIGFLLFLSGVISTVELVRFNRATYAQLQLNRTNIALSKEMLDAVQEQNTVLLMRVADTTSSPLYDSLIMINRAMFNATLDKAKAEFANYPRWADLHTASEEYRELVDNISDTLTIQWFSKVYKTSYYKLTNSIKEFMIDTQQQIVEYTSKLEGNAYRATMVAIIALMAGLILIVLFYYMINSYLVKPILLVQNALSRYLKVGLAFDVSLTANDEISELRDDISRLIQSNRK
ncbi:hypothetical ATPase-like protein [Mucinivorans hirudinis]|uniref:Hypothetical ATPase-like protein n=1 Tax=Mucinivorans hirudinis TaxID=1433126 RepID=A0A060R994_9BACT|nr:hypothetical ATPase-like protein [Mucinivorans hirudinis]